MAYLLYRRLTDQQRSLCQNVAYNLIALKTIGANRNIHYAESGWPAEVGVQNKAHCAVKLTSLSRSLLQPLLARFASSPRTSAGVWIHHRRAVAQPEPDPGCCSPSVGPARWSQEGARSVPGRTAPFWSTAPAGANTPRQRGAAEWGRRKVSGWPWRCCSMSCPPAACNRWRHCCCSPPSSRSAHPGRCPVHICGLNRLRCEPKRKARPKRGLGFCEKPSRCRRNDPKKPDTSN